PRHPPAARPASFGGDWWRLEPPQELDRFTEADAVRMIPPRRGWLGPNSEQASKPLSLSRGPARTPASRSHWRTRLVTSCSISPTWNAQGGGAFALILGDQRVGAFLTAWVGVFRLPSRSNSSPTSG